MSLTNSSIASTVHASPAKVSPQSGIDLAVGVPSSSASTGSGNIYLQIKAPSSYRWVAMGIGSQMAGSHIFMIYQNGAGNVTLSPRLGAQHVMPTYDSSAKVKLLAGSGVSNGFMTANIQYTASSSVIGLTSSSSPFISAWKQGDPVDSTDPAATITQHDDHAQFTIDLTSASISADANPYTSSSGSATASGSGASSTGTTSSGSGTSGSSSGSSTIILGGQFPLMTYQMAHGILMAASMVVLFPLGAIILRLSLGVWLHAAVQLITLAAITAGFGLGIRMAQATNYVSALQFLPHLKCTLTHKQLFNTTHTIFGTIIVCLFYIQPFLGLIHHQRFKKTHTRTIFGITHTWYGRILIICGVINGGLGLQLANNTMGGQVAYAAVAAIMFVTYVAVMVFVGFRNKRAAKYEARSP